MRLPLRRGRAFTSRDDTRTPGVVIINERAAREYWPGQDALGKRIAIGADNGNSPAWLTIVGIVANAKQEDWAAPPFPEVYLPALQNRDFLGEGTADIGAHMTYITLVVRGNGNAADLATAVKQTVWSFDRRLPVSAVFTMDRVVKDATAQPRFEMLLFTAFAAIALVLAVVGIYGVMSYSVSRRTREIGIRMSLGADRAKVLRMLIGQGMKQALAGAAAGIIGALLLSQLMTKMLYGIRPTDPVTLASAVAVLALAALAATCVPARSATHIEPMTALRNE